MTLVEKIFNCFKNRENFTLSTKYGKAAGNCQSTYL